MAIYVSGGACQCTYFGFSFIVFRPLIHNEAEAKINIKTTNPLPEVRARASALVRRRLTECGLVGQVAVRGVSPSGPPQLTTTVRGWPEARVKFAEKGETVFLMFEHPPP